MEMRNAPMLNSRQEAGMGKAVLELGGAESGIWGED